MLDEKVYRAITLSGYGKALSDIRNAIEQGRISISPEDKKIIENLWLVQIDYLEDY